MSTFVAIERPAPRNLPATSTVTARRRFGARLLLIARFVESQLEKRRSRLSLMEMTDDQLKDIGISRADAYCEARRGLLG